MNEPTDPKIAGSDPTVGWTVPPPTPARSGGMKARSWLLAVVVVVIGAWKIAAILGGSSVETPALSSAFGRPFDELPEDLRTRLETRVQAIAPANFDQLTDIQRFAWAQEQMLGGLVRLDDSTLTRRYRLVEEGIGQMPQQACAPFLRATAFHGTTSDATVPAFLTLQDAFLTALDVDQRMNLIEIAVEAMEAQARGTPTPRTVTTDQADAIFDQMPSLATPEEIRAVEAWHGDMTRSDDVLCAGARAFHAVALRLPVADFASVARYNVQP